VRCPDRGQDLVPDILEIEAGRLLHWRELNESLAHLGHLLLHIHEAPELVSVHVHHLRRAIVEPAPLERVEPEIEKPRPVERYFWSEPSLGLRTEDIFPIIDTHRGQSRSGEIRERVTRRGAFAGQHIRLVNPVEVHLEGLTINLLAVQQLGRDIRIASKGDKGREPIVTAKDPVLDLAGWNVTRPADDRRHPEAAFLPQCPCYRQTESSRRQAS